LTADVSEGQIRHYLKDKRNWGRWGDDDQRGTLNLLTHATRLAALSAVRSGEVLSLSRPIPTWVGSGNALPAQHYLKVAHSGGENLHSRPSDERVAGSATDYYGLPYHGVATTHLDALSHVWDADGMYNGKSPEENITFDGVTFGGIEQWSTGIFARAVLLDVPAHRGVDYVEEGEPVTGAELEEVAREQGASIEPGDAICVYSGRERWQAAHPDLPYGRYPTLTNSSNGRQHFRKPGLDASCLTFIRDHDVSALAWDMLDATPYDYDIPYAVHGAIHAYGLALIDNALLEELATACADRGHYDFLLVVSPLVVLGGTGSPVNPLAII